MKNIALALLFYIELAIIFILSLLPFWILYRISDFFYFLIYYVLSYRKKVVRTNLVNSFPEKSIEEIKKIEKGFYRFLCDMLIETFKILTISKKQAARRCVIDKDSHALMETYYKNGKSVVFAMGHIGNWELCAICSNFLLKHQVYFIYHPIKNKYFDKLIYKVRNRFGTKLYAMKSTLKGMLNNKNEINATGFVSDQAPQPEGAYWTTFLNQDTPVFFGIEKIAMKLNQPVLYYNIKRVKRGYYQINIDTITDHPKDTQKGEITEAFTHRLEQEIIKHPELWLWSHRRWKHKRSSGSGR